MVSFTITEQQSGQYSSGSREATGTHGPVSHWNDQNAIKCTECTHLYIGHFGLKVVAIRAPNVLSMSVPPLYDSFTTYDPMPLKSNLPSNPATMAAQVIIIFANWKIVL